MSEHLISQETTITPATPAPRTVSRERAALVHLGLSALVFVIVIVPLLMLWYPPPLFFSDGGWAVIRIAFGVDIVVGPLLTLVVFKVGKPGLKFDLGIIAALQIAALVWGIRLMYQEKPEFLVFADDRFSTITKGLLVDSKRPLDELEKFDGHRPPHVFVKLPDDPAEVLRMKLEMGARSEALFRLADRYEPMTAQNLARVYAQRLDMPRLVGPWPEYKADYEAFIAAHKADAGEYVFIPLECRYEPLIVAIDRRNGEFVEYLHIPLSKTNLLEKSPGAK
jgi:hypothetical protein